jgi:hypothetical protein
MRNIVLAAMLLIFSSISCFAQDSTGISGVYLCKRDDTQFLTLRQDETFVLKQRKKPANKENPFIEFTGTYKLDGETLTLTLDDGKMAKGQIKGNVFTDGQGDTWIKRDPNQQNVVRPKYKSWLR